MITTKSVTIIEIESILAISTIAPELDGSGCDIGVPFDVTVATDVEDEPVKTETGALVDVPCLELVAGIDVDLCDDVLDRTEFVE